MGGEFNGVNFTDGVSSSSLPNAEGAEIISDSRGVNIDGDNVSVDNHGSILGTADQRNGTVYADGDADNFQLNQAL